MNRATIPATPFTRRLPAATVGATRGGGYWAPMGNQRTTIMTSNRRTAIAIGVLFLVATATYIVGSALITPAKSADNLASLNQTHVRIGVFLELIDATAAVAIGVLLLPTLRRFSDAMGFAYAASRITESVLIMVSALSALLLIPLSEQYAQAAGSNASQVQVLAILVTTSYDLAFQIAMIALGIGSIALCYVLYVAKLVPRSLAVLGFLGYVSLLVSGWLTVFGSDLRVLLFAPGAVFEIVFPLWLIVKGFDERGLTKLADVTEAGARYDAHWVDLQGRSVSAIAAERT